MLGWHAQQWRGALLPLLAVALFEWPVAASALEPRFDHRDQKGPLAELLVARDVVWQGSTASGHASRAALRVGWGFDPTGDGNELIVGAAYTLVASEATSADSIDLVLDARYRACLGTDEFKTLLDLGVWVSTAERIAAGPMVGLGFIYDFTRNVGMFTSGFLSAGIGERRVVSFGGSIGLQLRYE